MKRRKTQLRLNGRSRALRDEIGLSIAKFLGSKNPDYPSDTYTSKKFVQLADELAHKELLRRRSPPSWEKRKR